MQQTLPHILFRKSHLPLLVSPICRFSSPNISYSLLNLSQSIHSDHDVTLFRLNYTAPLLCTLPSLQTSFTTVSSLWNIQMTSIRATNSANGSRNGTIIRGARIPMTSFMSNTLSSDPIRLLIAPDMFYGNMKFRWQFIRPPSNHSPLSLALLTLRSSINPTRCGKKSIFNNGSS